jgi:hypothetical protein
MAKRIVERMLKHDVAARLYLDYYPGDRESTVREIITETYPDFKSHLREYLKESLGSTEINIKLLAALQDDEYSTFHENLDSTKPNPWYDEPYHSSLLEIACQMKDRKRFVELLLERGADPIIKNRVTDLPLLHATARSGNFEVLEVLLKRPQIEVHLIDNKHRTILHWWAWVSERKPGDKERLENCFKHLLERDFSRKVGIDCKDISGMTPLCTAVELEKQDRVKLLLESGADVTACEYAGPILELSSTSQLEEILDYCLEDNNEPVNSENLEVKLRYQTLRKMLFLAEVPHHKDLLRHPALSIFVDRTWGKTAKPFLYLNIFFYFAFLLVLNAYILCFEFVDISNNRGLANSTNGRASLNDSPTISGMSDATRHNISNFTLGVLMVLLVLLLLRETFQIFVQRMMYIQSWENWLELLLIVATFTSCSGVVESMEVKRHLFAVVILLGWFELVLLLGRLPKYSVQMEMLKRVSSTFWSYMKGYIILILAFALGFYIIFKGNVVQDDAVLFANPFTSLLNTIVMFAGELEASDLPLDTLPGTSHVVFLLFVFLVTIILFNLLNGLAVGDTKDIRKKAETLSLVARARFISNTSCVLNTPPLFFTSSLELTEEMFTLYPNKPNQMGSTDRRSLRRIITKKRTPSRNVENWSLITEKLSALQIQ